MEETFVENEERSKRIIVDAIAKIIADGFNVDGLVKVLLGSGDLNSYLELLEIIDDVVAEALKLQKAELRESLLRRYYKPRLFVKKGARHEQ